MPKRCSHCYGHLLPDDDVRWVPKKKGTPGYWVHRDPDICELLIDDRAA